MRACRSPSSTPTAGGSTPARRRRPGTVVARRHGAVLVRTGDGAIWIGHLRSRADREPRPQAARHDRPRRPPRRRPRGRADRRGYREISYRRDGPVGVLDFRFYNGAMSTGQCRRLLAALRHATAQDTRVLLLRGGQPFSNGIHLGVIDAAADPAAEAWDNIVAIDDVCAGDHHLRRPAGRVLDGGQRGRGWGDAGAGRRPGAAPRRRRCSTRTTGRMGLYGSEYWTYVLPRRVGGQRGQALTTDCLPVGATHAARIGLVDQTLPGDPGVFERDGRTAGPPPRRRRRLPAAPRAQARAPRPRRTAQTAARLPPRANWTEMRADILDDRHGFAAARHGFILKRRARLAAGTIL